MIKHIGHPGCATGDCLCVALGEPTLTTIEPLAADKIAQIRAERDAALARATRAEAIAAAWREWRAADRAIGAASAPIDRHHTTHRDLAWRDRARLWAEEHAAEQETYDLAVARLTTARTALEALGENL